MQEILDTLREHKLSAETFEATINAGYGEGLSEHKANLDLTEIKAHLSQDPQKARALSAFARGVHVVLHEVPRSRAANYMFIQVAGRIFPIVETTAFSIGVKAASGSSAFTIPLSDDLVFAFIIETDRGWRCLTTAQVDSWGVAPDRVRAAARSMLYHRTRELPWVPVNEHVFQIKKGDGFDAARCMVFEDVFFGDVSPNFRFGIPDPDTLLFTRGDSPEELEALKTVVESSVAGADAPLSARLYSLDGFTLRPADH